MSDFDYADTRRLRYEGGETFVPVCVKCGRYVKADYYVLSNDWHGLSDKPNATCKKCGRTHMIFEGFYG